LDFRVDDDIALYYCVIYGKLTSIDYLRYFLEMGCNNQYSYDSALECAIQYGMICVVKYLMNWETVSAKHMSYAIKYGQYDMVQYFVKEGVAVNDEIVISAMDFGRLDVIEYFITNGMNISHLRNLNDHQRMIASYFTNDIPDHSLLIYCIKKVDLKSVQQLINRGVDIHAQDEEALIVAINQSSDKIVEYLIESGANIHVRDDEALVLALRHYRICIIELLIKYGFDIHTQDDEALIVSAGMSFSTELIEFLLENGADIMARNNEALMESIRHENFSGFSCLIKHGADIHAQTDLAFTLASEPEREKFAEFLAFADGRLKPNN
jgi:ankyrin repeat protein